MKINFALTDMTDMIAIGALFISSLSLVISLLGVILEGKRNQKQIIVTNISEYTKRYQDIILNLPRSVLDDDFNLNEFEEEEKFKILRYMWIYFDLCFEEYTLFELKLIDKEVWKLWKLGIKSSLKRSAFEQSWHVISQNTSYNSKFRSFMESIINM